MSNFDDIFAPQADTQPQELPPQESKQEWAERRKQEREAVYAMVDTTTERMSVNGEVFQDYLDVQARFDRYSVRNAILITAQNKDATKLASFDDWKADNISIKKGAKGISIMVPDEYRRKDSTSATGFAIGKVFDIAQTTAVATNRSISHDPRRLLETLVRNAPCPIEIRNDGQIEHVARYDPQSRKVYVRQGMEADALFRSIAQEIAVAEFARGHHKRSECEFDAYCVSYILCKRFGVSTDAYRFDKLPEKLSRQETKATITQLKEIRDTANKISDGMHQMLDAKQKAPKARSEESR